MHLYLAIIGIPLFILCIKCYFVIKTKRISEQIKIFQQRTYSDEKQERKKNRKIEKLKKQEVNCEKRRKKLNTYVCVPAAVLDILLVVMIFVNKTNGGSILSEKVAQEKIETIFLDAGYERVVLDLTDKVDNDKTMSNEEIELEIFVQELEFSLYAKAPNQKVKRKQFYIDYVDNLTSGLVKKDLNIDIGIRERVEDEEKIYSEKIRQLDAIENCKVPSSYSRKDVEAGMVTPKIVGTNIYMQEYEIRQGCYIIKPTLPMLQQMAKAASDASISLSLEKNNEEKMVEYAGNAVTDYLCLMRSDGAEESKADCCYWIANLFYTLSISLSKVHGDLIEHCELMSYAFCEKGVEYLEASKESDDQESNDQESVLLKLEEAMEVLTE